VSETGAFLFDVGFVIVTGIPAYIIWRTVQRRAAPPAFSIREKK
jgi:hypothetical protein